MKQEEQVMRFRPNITVAAVIRWQDKFLLVEERDHGHPVFNQPIAVVSELRSQRSA